MKITRNGVDIELTPQEVQQAYDIYLHDCKVMDAESQFKDWIEYEGFEVGLESDVKQFACMYGFAPNAASDPNNEHYLLEKFVSKFDEKFDCGRAENDIWHEAIADVMVEVMKKHTASKSDKLFELTYTETVAYKFTIRAKDACTAEQIWREKNAAGEAGYQCDNPSVVIEAYVKSVEEIT